MSTKSFFIDWELRDRIRRDALARRDALGEAERNQANTRIRDLVVESSLFQKANTIHIYLSIRSEVDTGGIIAKALALGKRVVVPRVYNHVMDPVDYLSVKNFTQSKFGTHEPEDGAIIDPSEIDVVFVPLAAIDSHGNRLGYGKGHYDAFLSQVPHVMKIGLAYELQWVEEMPARSEDIRLDMVVTEKGVKEFFDEL